MYQIKSPFVEITNNFEKLDDAYHAGQSLFKKDNAIKFYSIVQDKEIINTFIRPDYKACTFDFYKLADFYNAIKDFFIIYKDGHETIYIKLKKF